jgi:predicted nuclease of predicted toxin-antitoxin system
MRILIDNALSPLVASRLQEAGHDAIHVRHLAMQAATDEDVFDFAARDDRVLISADTDFALILAQRMETKPSIVLFRGASPRRPEEQAAFLASRLPGLEEDLRAGCVVVVEHDRLRIRRLPIAP